MKAKQSFDFVLDCSVVMAWCFQDEQTSFTQELLNSMTEKKAVVPQLWPLEVTNVLLLAERRQRITALQATAFIDALRLLPVVVDSSTSTRAWQSIYTLAKEVQLTIYDATYLELAMRENIPIATLDKQLIAAAQKLSVATLC